MFLGPARTLFLLLLVTAAAMLPLAHRSIASTRSDPGSMSPVAKMLEPRSGHSATLLPDGRVLIAGGMVRNGEFLKSAELFDPESNRFVRTGEMSAARVGQSSALLNDGKVLIAGGWKSGGGTTAKAELYDPATGKFTPLPDMTAARARACATVLKDGRVLISGGAIDDFTPLASAEIFDPAVQRFTAVNGMSHARVGQTASILPNGDVLIAGGRDGNRHVLSAAEVFDTHTSRFREAGKMLTARYKHTAAVLKDGRVLIAGGSDERDWTGQLNGVEVFDPTRNIFSSLPPMAEQRFKLPEQAAVLPSGLVLIAGGSERSELFDPKAGGFVGVEGTIDGPRHYMSETLLKNGDVLLAGGYTDSDRATTQAWLFRNVK